MYIKTDICQNLFKTLAKKKIAFFDSGVGGLSVFLDARRLLPFESFVYFADTDHTPYGTKSRSKINDLVIDAVDYLHDFDLKALVIACNTATSSSIKLLRSKYDFPIIGMEPAIKVAADKQSKKKILVCATDFTLKEDKLSMLISKLSVEEEVNLLSLQKLVLFAENLEFRSSKVLGYLENKFQEIDWADYHSIVLGCTHFIFYKAYIKNLVPDHIEVIDGNAGTVNNLLKRIEPTKIKTKGRTIYYKSKKRVSRNEFLPFIQYLASQY